MTRLVYSKGLIRLPGVTVSSPFLCYLTLDRLFNLIVFSQLRNEDVGEG